VKTLVTLHGGSVAVSSDGAGKGSEFAVRLPLVPTVRPEADGQAEQVRPACRRVLLVEDQHDVREMFRELLRLLGHEVVVAATGPEGVEVFRRERPEVVFIDIGLPGMDGFGVLRALRAEPGGADVCLVALTGYAQPEDQRRALEAGFDLHLAKPVGMEQVEKLLAAVGKSERGGTGR
jgi:CheY-like chemotaxis protein